MKTSYFTFSHSSWRLGAVALVLTFCRLSSALSLLSNSFTLSNNKQIDILSKNTRNSLPMQWNPQNSPHQYLESNRCHPTHKLRNQRASMRQHTAIYSQINTITSNVKDPVIEEAPYSDIESFLSEHILPTGRDLL